MTGCRLGIRAVALATLFTIATTPADAAYRITFKNGSSVEVSSYEDLGDAIRYPRLGGAVIVSKANLASIEEAVHLPAPEKPAATRPTPATPAPAPQSLPARVRAVAANAAARGTQLALDAFFFVRPILPIMLLALLVAGAGAGLLYGLRRFARRRKMEDLPYTKVAALLTEGEQVFYAALRKAVAERWALFAKVRMSDVLDVPRRTMNRQAHSNRIDRKHIDFLLCSPADFAPLLAIELDDRSHQRPDRERHDAFLHAALDAAGVTILRIPARLVYDPAELRAAIEKAIGDFGFRIAD